MVVLLLKYMIIKQKSLIVTQVWDQCFAARFACPDRFAKAVEADPTIFHKFQDIVYCELIVKEKNILTKICL